MVRPPGSKHSKISSTSSCTLKAPPYVIPQRRPSVRVPVLVPVAKMANDSNRGDAAPIKPAVSVVDNLRGVLPLPAKIASCLPTVPRLQMTRPARPRKDPNQHEQHKRSNCNNKSHKQQQGRSAAVLPAVKLPGYHNNLPDVVSSFNVPLLKTSQQPKYFLELFSGSGVLTCF
jgi:hypothetical protein